MSELEIEDFIKCPHCKKNTILEVVNVRKFVKFAKNPYLDQSTLLYDIRPEKILHKFGTERSRRRYEKKLSKGGYSGPWWDVKLTCPRCNHRFVGYKNIPSFHTIPKFSKIISYSLKQGKWEKIERLVNNKKRSTIPFEVLETHFVSVPVAEVARSGAIVASNRNPKYLDPKVRAELR